MNVTYVTTELPYPVRHGGVMATDGFIRAIAASASVSVLVLGHRAYSDEVIREATNYYTGFCDSFACHQFDNLSPSGSPLIKAWHYLSGYPRHGFWNEEADLILRDHLNKTKSDVVWCNSTLEAKYLPAARRMKCRTVLTTHNVESHVVEQGTNGDRPSLTTRVRTWDMRRLEKFAAQWADVITGITNTDCEYYARLKGHDRAFLLGFGYSLPQELSNNGAPEEQDTICFIGSMNWRPNVDAAHYLVEQVMPLIWRVKPAAKCFLVGRNADAEVRALGAPNVIVTGEVPSVRKYYDSASVIVVPAQEVAGIKVKLIEAMALGKAVVSTTAGVAGLNVEHDRHLMIADRPREFADAILRLLNDESKRRQLGGCAREFVAANLSPRETEHQAQQILNRLLELSPNE